METIARKNDQGGVKDRLLGIRLHAMFAMGCRCRCLLQCLSPFVERWSRPASNQRLLFVAFRKYSSEQTIGTFGPQPKHDQRKHLTAAYRQLFF
jgi:hypothetical protein